jgi:dTDP-4-dehydrorhamnose 3,5-epimerase-like enzyme
MMSGDFLQSYITKTEASRYDDPMMNINWPHMEKYIISEKDMKNEIFTVEKAYHI